MDFENAILVKEETEGCLNKTSTKRKLSSPHSATIIDFDGDCMSDLFLTVTDGYTTYYEIFMRREIDLDNEDESMQAHSNGEVSGLNTFCLISRVELPRESRNLISFADVDRDSLVDMIYVSKDNLNLNIYYNKLQYY